jgi:putative ABC transport system permease protein
MAVGLGVFVLMTVHWMRTTFQASLDRQTTADLPDLYFVDVQVDQMAPLAEMVERVSGHGADLVLTAPARIAGIDGEEIDLERVESVVDRQRLSRDYIVTTKTELAPNEEVVDGEWWPPSPGLAPEVSVDTSLAEDFGFTVNRRLLLDLRGTRIEARIAAVRKIDWAKGRLGFMIAFRPGSLDNIAMSAVGAVIGPADTQARGRLVRELSDRFPNVSILDTRDVVASLRQALASIGTALSIVGGVVVVAGLLILIGSVSMTRFLREYEIAVLKTLGARWRQIAMVNALEFVVLGGLAGVIGTALAGVLVWVLAEQVLDLDFAVDAVGAVVAFIASALVVGAAGVAATADLLMVRPLALLRGE